MYQIRGEVFMLGLGIYPWVNCSLPPEQTAQQLCQSTWYCRRMASVGGVPQAGLPPLCVGPRQQGLRGVCVQHQRLPIMSRFPIQPSRPAACRSSPAEQQGVGHRAGSHLPRPQQQCSVAWPPPGPADLGRRRARSGALVHPTVPGTCKLPSLPPHASPSHLTWCLRQQESRVRAPDESSLPG